MDKWQTGGCIQTIVDCLNSKTGAIKTVFPDFRLIFSVNGLNMSADTDMQIPASGFGRNDGMKASAFFLDTFVTRLFNASIPCCTD